MKTSFFFYLMAISAFLAPQPLAGESSGMRTLAKGAYCNISKPRQEVIKDLSTFKSIWKQLSTQTPDPIPEIDFSREMVVLVAMGQKPTGGYFVEITKIQPAGKRLRIEVFRKSPPPDAILAQVVTSPFHLVAVPKSSLSPEFQ